MTSPQPPSPPEFIFGAMSTEAGRTRRARTQSLGFIHEITPSPADPRPGEAITLKVRVGSDVAVKSVALTYTTDGSPPKLSDPTPDSPSICVAMARSRIVWDTLSWGFVEEWAATIPPQANGVWVNYVISAVTDADQLIVSPYFRLEGQGSRENLDTHFMRQMERRARNGQPQTYGFQVDEEIIPQWLREAVIYQIFVDRFAPAPGAAMASHDDLSGFYGGHLNGIRANLDYLGDLGIDALWLTPIFPSPSHHGYDPTDYRSIEPRLGTAADFRALLAAAHERGIRVVLDLVANHFSSQHPAFLAAQKSPDAPTRSWFYFREHPDVYDSFYDVPSQPIVDTDNAEVRAYLVEAAQYWLDMGVDGFRLDHAHGATHAFWSAFRAGTRSARADSVTFGEITDTPAVMRSYVGRMDGVLDFQLLELMRGFFVFNRLTASQFDLAVAKHLAYFGSDLVLPSFLDNHDMNRFLWSVGGDKRRLRLAALCQFTLPGPPIIYYGTEVGLSQQRGLGRLEEARLPMPWGEAQDVSLLQYYRDLIALRRRMGDVWSSPRRPVLIDDARGLYVYASGDWVVALNNHDTPAAITLPGAGKLQLAFSTDAEVTLGRRRRLQLPPFAGAVCAPPGSQAAGS
ncbi:MAG: alpha-amylase family glycosyl hydrolase [Anaerolineae bacterium]